MVKDSIMKIKKNSKSNVDLHDLSGKKAINGKEQDGQEATTDSKIEDKIVKQRKKHKKQKREINESEQPLKEKKNINDQARLTNVPLANGERPDTSGKEDTATNQERDSSHVLQSSTKDTLMVRLRNASTHMNNMLSLLHIPKHKNPGADESEEDDG